MKMRQVLKVFPSLTTLAIFKFSFFGKTFKTCLTLVGLEANWQESRAPTKRDASISQIGFADHTDI